MTKSIVAATAALAFMFAGTASASIPGDEDHQPTPQFLSLKQAKHDVKLFASAEHKKNGSVSFLVFKCYHVTAGHVDCRVRYRFRDTDGVTGFTRWTAHHLGSSIKLVQNK